MILGAPIAFAMLIAGLAAVAMKSGLSPLVVMQNHLFSGLDSFPLLPVRGAQLSGSRVSKEWTEKLVKAADSARK
jgi:hypothetical protein